MPNNTPTLHYIIWARDHDGAFAIFESHEQNEITDWLNADSADLYTIAIHHCDHANPFRAELTARQWLNHTDRREYIRQIRSHLRNETHPLETANTTTSSEKLSP